MSAIKLREEVASRIAAISGTVNERVVETLVQQETEKRANTIAKGLEKLAEAEREFYKVNKPDIVSYNEDGSVASSSYSQERLKAKKEATEKVEKVRNALDKAISDGDMDKLYGLVK